MFRLSCSPCYWRALVFAVVAALALILCVEGSAQAPANGPKITGAVVDGQGVAVRGARVIITNKATAESVTIITDSAGAYTSGPLSLGNYLVRVEADGFMPSEITITLQVSTTSATGNVKIIRVRSVHLIALPVNTDNYADLTQLEPGVQVQNGGTFDPAKSGSASVSVDGRFGRTTRVELDGVDISDETVGATTQNLPLDSIQEPVVQSSSDVSVPLASSGSVRIATKSGTPGLHGEGFYDFRDQQFNADLPGGSKNPFQRNEFGGNIGGPVIKDKLFFFLDGERNKQDWIAPAYGGGDFAGLASTYSSPLRETEGVGRLDYQSEKYKGFYRFSYDQSSSVFPLIPNAFQPTRNENNSRDHVVGVDFNRGNYTHSLRLGYSQYHNGVTDAVTGSSIFNPAPGIELAIGADPNCLTPGLDDFCSGPSYLAPQTTFQSNLQIKYDGSRPLENHNFHFGLGLDRIQGGGFAEFLGTAPAVGAPSLSPGVRPPCFAAGNCPDAAAGPTDPLNYAALNVMLGNGQGFSSEKSAFGYPGGGLGPDNRFTAYIGDTWKTGPSFTLTWGLNYVRDTGRTDSDLGSIAALTQFNVSHNQFYSYSGLDNRVHQPNFNLAPHLGFAWDTSGTGKTILRAGAGVFYANSIWNNILFDRSARLSQGLFLGFTSVCSSGSPQTLPFASTIDPATICDQPIGTVAPLINQLEQQYQAATLAAGPGSNAGYIGNSLADGINITGSQLLAPDYVSPRSIRMSLGFEHELRPGSVISVNYVRNVSTHELLSVDTNHVGDYRFFEANAALAAVNATVGAACGGGTVTTGSSIGAVQCFISQNPTATISAFAANGLDSGYTLCGGRPCQLIGRPAAAFPGINSALGANQMLFPIGRSRYQGLQTVWKHDAPSPLPGIRHATFQVAYEYSRYDSTARDGDFINFAQDNNAPLRYVGPNALDRTHQFSLGGIADLPARFHFTFLAHFDSPLPSSVTLPVSGLPGGIFQTDVTGDGTGDGSPASNGGLGDLLPGTNVGGFGRSFSIGGLNQAIDNYNLKYVGTLTPAGQVLLGSGLFSQSELTALQAVIGGNQNGSGAIAPLESAQTGAVGQGWLKTFDTGVNWTYKVKDKVELRPGVTFFNVFNMANFDGPAAPFTSVLNGQAGSPNATLSAQPYVLRLGLGSGVNGLGTPRVVQFELKIAF
jgi:hypothetical protein